MSIVDQLDQISFRLRNIETRVQCGRLELDAIGKGLRQLRSQPGAAILKDADLTTTSAKKVRQQIEEKLEVDLTERKKEVDDLVMECLEKKQDGGKGKDSSGGKKRSKNDDDDAEDDEEEESDDAEEEEEEEEERKEKRSAAKKPVKRAKKGSSDEESEDGSDDNASDEEYSPTGGAKKGKGGKKGKGKGKKKGSDSDNDSDEDWNKSRRSSSAPAKKAAAGGKRGGGGYTRAYTLSPELAAVVGQDSMARHEVVRKIWSIIKERNLYDPKNKQFAICDDELLKVFGVKRFRTFGMMKYLKNHFID